MKQLLVATNNKGKLVELRELLDGFPVELLSLGDLIEIIEVKETGQTFIENARLKASGYAQQTGLPALADDSGLEVSALDGRPGVLSARYGGVDKSFDEKMQILLSEMDRSDSTDRNAWFVSAIAIADADGNILYTTEGICNGKIAAGPLGSGGFCYDPVFIPDGYQETFGELSSSIKRQISHRARAFNQIMPFLGDFIAV